MKAFSRREEEVTIIIILIPLIKQLLPASLPSPLCLSPSSSSSWRQNPNKTESIHLDEEKNFLYNLDFTHKGIKSKSLLKCCHTNCRWPQLRSSLQANEVSLHASKVLPHL
jgi:hypothetical protein